MSFTVEISEVQVLSSIICVLLVAVIWLWFSKQKQEKIAAEQKQEKINKQKTKPTMMTVYENKDKEVSNDSDDELNLNDVDLHPMTTHSSQQSRTVVHSQNEVLWPQQTHSIHNSLSSQHSASVDNEWPMNVHHPSQGMPLSQPIFDQRISLGNLPQTFGRPVDELHTHHQGYSGQAPYIQVSMAEQAPCTHMAGQTPYTQVSMAGQAPHAQISVTESRCQALLKSSQCLSQGSPSIYKLSVKISKTGTENIEKGEVGTPSHITKPTRVFMAVGATGAGKSTLINGMVNYVLGVKFEDDFRFKLITDEVKESQAHSQTQKITSYTIYWHEGSPVDYNLIIVDTPGFGDTRGLQRDRQITAQIKDFFSIKGDSGIDQIHGIGFVAQSSLPRLTPTQKYVFDSVLSVFGKDIVNNIFIMATFADGSDPPVKAAIKAAKIPYCKFLEFNNECLFMDGSNRLASVFWGIVYDSFQSFFQHFARTEAISLQLTRDVLNERQTLEIIITGLQKQISNGLSKIEYLNQVEKALKSTEADISRSKNFTVTTTINKAHYVSIAGTGRYVTNCKKCNFTCHEDCAFNDSSDKHKCSAMDGGGINNAMCRTCPGRCFWRHHENNPFYYEYRDITTTETLEDLKRQFQDATKKKTDVQGMIATIEKELKDMHNKIFLNIRQARQCIQRLDEIALKPNPLTDVEYISLLIQAEQSEKKKGYENRVKFLMEVKEQAKLMAKLSDEEIEKVSKEGATTWWKKYQDST